MYIVHSCHVKKVVACRQHYFLVFYVLFQLFRTLQKLDIDALFTLNWVFLLLNISFFFSYIKE